MTSKEQNIAFLHQYIKARRVAPFIAEFAESNIVERLQRLGGIAGTWRTDYSECTYCRVSVWRMMFRCLQFKKEL